MTAIINSTYTDQEHKTMADEILRQLGGRQFIAMTGARNFHYSSTESSGNLSFRFMGSRAANYLKITLEASDTYTLTFYTIRKFTAKIVKVYTDIYNEDLQRIFTDFTGLYTTL